MKFRYAEMTWREVRDAAAENRVAVLPVATYEDHGDHLPVDVDVVLCTEICDRAVSRIPSEAVLAPPVTHGFSPHHMDFPGPITIEWDTFVKYVRDVCCSLARHGFSRVLVVNGHGSNASPLDLAARLSILATEGKMLCATVSHWGIRSVRELGRHLRESGYGGTSHAGEYETSLYLALRPDLVEMDRAVDEDTRLSPSFQSDLLAGGHPEGSDARMMPYWSTLTDSGVRGRARLATVEKGSRLLAAAEEGLVALIRELRNMEIRSRVDHH